MIDYPLSGQLWPLSAFQSNKKVDYLSLEDLITDFNIFSLTMGVVITVYCPKDEETQGYLDFGSV